VFFDTLTYELKENRLAPLVAAAFCIALYSAGLLSCADKRTGLFAASQVGAQQNGAGGSGSLGSRGTNTAQPAQPPPAATASERALPRQPLRSTTIQQETAKAFVNRPYWLSYANNGAPSPRPLFLFLHGLGASAEAVRQAVQLEAFTQQNDIVAAVPEGSLDSHRRRFWNATNACCDYDGLGTNDVAYIAAVIADVRAKRNIDDQRIFVVGYSNGGFMAHRLACDLSDVIVGIASFSGVGHQNTKLCQPTRPVAVLQIHGDSDKVVDINGGRPMGRADLPRHPSATSSLAFWARHNGCDASLTPSSLDPHRVSGKETKRHHHTQCSRGAAELWTVREGSHFIGLDRDSLQAAYQFLMIHPRPIAKTVVLTP